MQCIMLKVKLYQVCVIYVEFEYEGFCVIDGCFMDMVGIFEYEQIQIYNLDNGECFEIYVICGEEGLKMIFVNGVVVYKVQFGYCVIICVYVNYFSFELINYKFCLIYMDVGNEVKGISNVILVQVV